MSKIPTENPLIQRHRRFAKAMAKRNKRRSSREQNSRWPVVYSDLLVLTLTLTVLSYFLFDEAAHQVAAAAPTGVIRFFRMVTDIGKSEWVLVPSGVLCLVLVFVNWQSFPPRRQAWLSSLLFDAWFIFVSVAGSGILVNFVKQIASRARPRHSEAFGTFFFDPFRFEASFASFPSGHSATIAALATALSLRFPMYRPYFIGLALLVGASRVFVGVHYLSDVIVGIAMGALFTLFVARSFAIRKIGFRFDDNLPLEAALPRRRILRGIR